MIVIETSFNKLKCSIPSKLYIFIKNCKSQNQVNPARKPVKINKGPFLRALDESGRCTGIISIAYLFFARCCSCNSLSNWLTIDYDKLSDEICSLLDFVIPLHLIKPYFIKFDFILLKITPPFYTNLFIISQFIFKK